MQKIITESQKGISELQKGIIEAQQGIIIARNEAFEQLVKETFGDNLPEADTWNRIYFQEDSSIIALVPANEPHDPNLLKRVLAGEFPYCRVALSLEIDDKN